MLGSIRQELLPIVIVIVVLGVWASLQLGVSEVPDDVQTLATAVVMYYFGTRTGGSAAARALNGYYQKAIDQGSETHG